MGMCGAPQPMLLMMGCPKCHSRCQNSESKDTRRTTHPNTQNLYARRVCVCWSGSVQLWALQVMTDGFFLFSLSLSRQPSGWAADERGGAFCLLHVGMVAAIAHLALLSILIFFFRVWTANLAPKFHVLVIVVLGRWPQISHIFISPSSFSSFQYVCVCLGLGVCV